MKKTMLAIMLLTSLAFGMTREEWMAQWGAATNTATRDAAVAKLSTAAGFTKDEADFYAMIADYEGGRYQEAYDLAVKLKNGQILGKAGVALKIPMATALSNVTGGHRAAAHYEYACSIGEAEVGVAAGELLAADPSRPEYVFLAVTKSGANPTDALLNMGRINLWTPQLQQVFDAIPVDPETETEYRAFCGKLNFLILPVEANIEIKTLLKRISDGQ